MRAASPGRRRCLRLFSLPLLPLLGVAACGVPDKRAPAVGDRFPDFTLADLDRQLRRFADFAGGPLLVNFWATWCPPCRAEMAGLKVLHYRLRAAGGGVVAISVDDDMNLVREFVRQGEIDFPVLLDPGRRFAGGTLAITSYPTSLVVGRDGRIADIVVGVRDWQTPQQAAAVLAAAGA